MTEIKRNLYKRQWAFPQGLLITFEETAHGTWQIKAFRNHKLKGVIVEDSQPPEKLWAFLQENFKFVEIIMAGWEVGHVWYCDHCRVALTGATRYIANTQTYDYLTTRNPDSFYAYEICETCAHEYTWNFIINPNGFVVHDTRPALTHWKEG